MMGALTLYNITPARRCSPNSRISSGADRRAADRQRHFADHEPAAGRPVHAHADHPAVVPGAGDRRGVGGGVYAVHSTTFDLLLMVGLGVFGYILRKMHFPMSPLILGFVLGEMLEQNLRRALSISNGEFGILWSSSIAQTLLVLAVAVLALPPLLRLMRKRRQPAAEAKAE